LGGITDVKSGEQEVVAAQKDLEDSINQGSAVILEIFPVVWGISEEFFRSTNTVDGSWCKRVMC